jgi:hypothetical protein
MEERGDEVVHGGRDSVGYVLAYMVDGMVLGGRTGAAVVLLDGAHDGGCGWSSLRDWEWEGFDMSKGEKWFFRILFRNIQRT